MTIVDIEETAERWLQIIARAEDGEEVVIARRGRPIVRVTAVRPKGERTEEEAADPLKGDAL